MLAGHEHDRGAAAVIQRRRLDAGSARGHQGLDGAAALRAAGLHDTQARVAAQGFAGLAVQPGRQFAGRGELVALRRQAGRVIARGRVGEARRHGRVVGQGDEVVGRCDRLRGRLGHHGYFRGRAGGRGHLGLGGRGPGRQRRAGAGGQQGGACQGRPPQPALWQLRIGALAGGYGGWSQQCHGVALRNQSWGILGNPGKGVRPSVAAGRNAIGMIAMQACGALSAEGAICAMQKGCSPGEMQPFGLVQCPACRLARRVFSAGQRP